MRGISALAPARNPGTGLRHLVQAGSVYLPGRPGVLGRGGPPGRRGRGQAAGRRSPLAETDTPGEKPPAEAVQTCTFDRTLETSENRQALARVRKYAEEFSRDSGGLFLTGPVGTGKTHMAACLVNELIGREIRVLFGNVLDLLGRLRRSYDEDAQEEEWRILDELATVPLLVIDDLGKEKVSEWVEQTL